MSLRTRFGCCTLASLVLLVGAAAKPVGAAETNSAAILDQVGVQRGIAMVLGDPDGKLAVALAQGSELTLYVQSPSSDAVAVRASTGTGSSKLGPSILRNRARWR